MAIVFVFAQLLLAAHSPAEAGEYGSHTSAECVFCLATPLTPDPDANVVKTLAPDDAVECIVASINRVEVSPAIYADASPRAPPYA